MELRKNEWIESLPQIERKKKKKVRVRVQKKVATKSSVINKVTTLAFILFVLLSFLTIAGFTKIYFDNMELQKLTQTREELEAQRDYLTMELETYKESSRIEEIARSSLGMDYPNSDQYVKMDLNGETSKLYEENITSH